MLQFTDQIKSKKGFVDLHIHTNDSYGEEMDKMNLTPEELLESIYQISVNNQNAPITFAITDHNSIDGVQKVDILIKSDPEKYKNIKFLTGCEFSCSAGSLGTYTNPNGHTRNIIKNFHMLAYGFNAFDENMQFLTKLHSTRKDNSIICEKVEYLEKIKIKIPAGTYVLAIKNMLKDYGYNYPISEFKDVNLKTRNIDERTYIKYLMNYITKFNLPDNITRDIHNQLRNRNIHHLGKLDVMEIMEVVEKAGGYCVLAHPKLLETSTKISLNNIKSSEFKKFITKNKNENPEQHHRKYSLIKYVVESLKNRAKSQVDGRKLTGIVGIEALHSSSSYNKNLTTDILEIAKSNNLYLTCGSDFHGTLLKDDLLSLCFPTSFLEDENINSLVVNKNLFSELLYNNQLNSQLDCHFNFNDQLEITVCEDKNIVINKEEDLIDFINSKHNKFHKANYAKKQTEMFNNNISITPTKPSKKQEKHLEALKKLRNLEKQSRKLIKTLKNINDNIDKIISTSQNRFEAINNYNSIKKTLKFSQHEFALVIQNYEYLKKYSATIYANKLLNDCNEKLNNLAKTYNFTRDDYLKFVKLEDKKDDEQIK